jgi:glucokinase
MAVLLASIDLGGTNTACALATADGSLVAQRSIPTDSHEGPERVLDRIAAAVEDLAQTAGGRPEAVGMGVPGLVDRDTGVVRFVPNLPTQWRAVPAARHLGERLGCPVHLLNDARMATLGELAFGRGRGVGTMIFFTIGTGIGGGVVIDGTLRLGALGAAGELGHQVIEPNGPPCGCGGRGCLETLASGTAIAAEGVRLMRMGMAPRLHEMSGGSADRVDTRLMAEAATAGDAHIRATIVRAGAAIGIGAANIVHSIHPELVVLGGGVAQIGALLIDAVRDTMVQRVGMFPAHDVRVEQSALGDLAGLYGGVALAAHRGKI